MHRPASADDAAIVRDLADAARRHDGHPPLGDAVWRDLAHPSPDSAVLLASSDGVPVGALHVAPPDNTTTDATVTAGIVVHPDHRGEGVERALVDAACEDAARHGAARILLWAFGADDRADALAASAGFTQERELQQLRVPLPLTERPRWPDGVTVRPFRPGVDDDAWLAVNNRAFAHDPDQSGWTHATLQRRLEEPWFDPEGFLLAWDDAGLAGFCWTKLHPADPPVEPDVVGEIYVIGVDPDRQGSGLGRALVVAGLEWLHGAGARVGMLFVDAANSAAVRLYHALGFTVARRDRAYARALS